MSKRELERTRNRLINACVDMNKAVLKLKNHEADLENEDGEDRGMDVGGVALPAYDLCAKS